MRSTPWGTYARIAEQLRERLANVAPGSVLPSETSLAAEFGRTPQINNRAGRDHFIRGWTIVLPFDFLASAPR